MHDFIRAGRCQGLVTGWYAPGTGLSLRASQPRGLPAKVMACGTSASVTRRSRHLGHNPLGGWMIVLLLIVIALVGLSGWLYTTDRYWGVEWVGELHEALADALLVLIALHVGGVALASYRHRENLFAAMLHGRKRPAGADEG